MAGEERDRFEIPKDMRSMAEASFDQARKGFEKFIAGAQAAADSLSARTATVGAGAKDASKGAGKGVTIGAVLGAIVGAGIFVLSNAPWLARGRRDRNGGPWTTCWYGSTGRGSWSRTARSHTSSSAIPSSSRVRP